MAAVKGSIDVKKKPTTTITIPGTGGVKVQTVAPKPTNTITIPGTGGVKVQTVAPVPAVKTAAPTTKPVSGVNGGLSSIQNQSKATGPVTAPTVSAVKALGVAAPTAVTTPSMKINQAQVTNKLIEAKDDAQRAQIASAIARAPSAKVAPDVANKIEKNVKATQEAFKQVSAEALEAGLNPNMISAQAQTAERQQAEPFIGQTVSPTPVPTSYTDAMPEVPTVEQPAPTKKVEQAPPAIDVGGGATIPGAGTGLPVQATPTDLTFADIIDGTVYGNFMEATAEIANSVFSWDPSKDQEYLNDAAIIENQVTQMMVGRGGLYSSVHQATLTTQLISLQVEMRKQKYDEYVADRNFKMNIIQTQWGMFMDQANLQLNYEKMKFDQAMQQAQLQLSYAKFKADREDAAWSKYMAEQEYKLKVSQANEAKELANQKNLLSMQALALKSDQADVGSLLDTWASTGVIKPELRAYANAYGIELPNSMYYSFNSNEYSGVSEARTAFNNAFSMSSNLLLQSAVTLDDLENFGSLYVGKSYLANQPTASGYSEDTDSPTQKSNYMSAYNSIIGSSDVESAATKILDEYAKGSYNFELKYGSGSSELLTQAQKALNPMYGA